MSLSVSTSRLSNWTTTRSIIVARSSGAMSMSGAAVTSIPPEWIEGGAGSRRCGHRTRASAPSRQSPTVEPPRAWWRLGLDARAELCAPGVGAADRLRAHRRSARAVGLARRRHRLASSSTGIVGRSARRPPPPAGRSRDRPGQATLGRGVARHPRRRTATAADRRPGASGAGDRPAASVPPSSGTRARARRPLRPCFRRSAVADHGGPAVPVGLPRRGRPGGSAPGRRLADDLASPRRASSRRAGHRGVRILRRRWLAGPPAPCRRAGPCVQLAHPVDETVRLGDPRPAASPAVLGAAPEELGEPAVGLEVAPDHDRSRTSRAPWPPDRPAAAGTRARSRPRAPPTAPGT